MSADVIDLSKYCSQGNGAREALIEIMGDAGAVDVLLCRLWYAGFKVIPLDDGDTE